MSKRNTETCSVATCRRPFYARGFCSTHYQRLRITGDAQAEMPIGGYPPHTRTCAVDDCERRAKSMGWCDSHYARWKLNGDVNAEKPLRACAGSWDGVQCAVESCDRPVESKGLCATHKMREYSGSKFDDDVPIKTPLPKGTPCSFPGCAKPHYGHGYCAAHHGQLARGEELRPLRVRGVIGTKKVNKDGYVEVVIAPGKKRREHQLVMEDMIGRPLDPAETVHHRNGVRDDNRPKNLELWASRHPAGQRITDLVDWAYEIIETYADEAKLMRSYGN